MIKRKFKSSLLSKYFSFMIPSLLSMLVVSAYTFTDTFVVGQELGANGLAAIGVATPVLTLFFALGFLFGEGGGTAYSVLQGQGNSKGARVIYTEAIILAVLTGVAIIIFGNIFIYQIARFLGATEENIALTVEYMRYIIIFSPVIILDLTTNNFMRNDGAPKMAMLSTAIGSSANIVLDCVFVFVFKWGMFGASIATCLGSCIAVIINFSYSIIKKRNIVLAKIKIVWKDVKRIYTNGFASFILQFSIALITFFYVKEAFNHYGDLGISAYTIVMNWNIIAMNLIIGVAQATQPLISLNQGKGAFENVKKFRKYGLCACAILGMIYLPICLFGARGLSAVFVQDNEALVSLSVQALKIVSVTYIFLAITVMLAYFYEATEKVKQSMAINLCRGCVLPTVFVFVVPMFLDKLGVWVSIPLAEAVSAIFAMLLFCSTLKEEKGTILQRNFVEIKKHNSLIVTISREFGSGGREIGERVARKLNVQCYDKILPVFSSNSLGIDSKIVEEKEEQIVDGFKFGLFSNGKYKPISNEVFYSQCDVIKEIASKGACVIVGRCADSILRHDFHCLNVFVYAPKDFRAKRIMEYEKCSEAQAFQMLEESDNARKEYHNFYADKEWGLLQSYDLSVNSGIGIDLAVELICDAYKELNTKS